MLFWGIGLAICPCCNNSEVLPTLHTMSQMNVQGIDKTFVQASLNVLEWQVTPREKVQGSVYNFHVLYFQRVIDLELPRTHLPTEGYMVEFAERMASLIYHHYLLIGCQPVLTYASQYYDNGKFQNSLSFI